MMMRGRIGMGRRLRGMSRIRMMEGFILMLWSQGGLFSSLAQSIEGILRRC